LLGTLHITQSLDLPSDNQDESLGPWLVGWFDLG